MIACQNGHGICGKCIDTQVERNLHLPSIVCPFDACFSPPYSEEQLDFAVSEKVYKTYRSYADRQMRILRLMENQVSKQVAFQGVVLGYMEQHGRAQGEIMDLVGASSDKQRAFQSDVLKMLQESDDNQVKELRKMTECISDNAHEQAEFHYRLLQQVGTLPKNDSGVANGMMARILKGLTHYIAGTKELCPRWVVLEIPDSQSRRPKRPKEWFKSLRKVKANLYLVCQHSHRRLETPIELEVNREWVQKVAPVLKYTLMALKIACEAGLSSTIAQFIPSNLLSEQDSFYTEMLTQSLDAASLAALDHVGQAFDSSTLPVGVTHLTEQAYELMAEKLVKEKRSWWRQRMVPVMDEDGHIIYVMNEYASQYMSIA